MTNIWTKAEDNRILELSERGFTAHDIARELKRTVASVWTRKARIKKLANEPNKPIVEKVKVTAFYIEGGLVFNTKPQRQYNYERPENTYDLTELEKDMCRFAKTDTLPYYFCGKKIHRGAYCKECAKKCYK